MNFIDIILLIPLLYAAYKGFSKGIISQAAALAALILGVIGAIRFSGITAGFLIEEFGFQTDYMHILSFGVTFMIIVLLVHLVARITNQFIKAVALGFLNRLFGLVFSVVKVAFILSILLILFIHLNHNVKLLEKEELEESILFGPVSSFAPRVFPYLKFEGLENPFKKNKQEKETGKDIEV